MNQEELRLRLQELRSELQQMDLDDESKRATIQQLMVQIERLLDSTSPPNPPGYEPLGDSLKSGIEQFEESHPTATLLMGQTMDLLSRMGI